MPFPFIRSKYTLCHYAFLLTNSLLLQDNFFDWHFTLAGPDQSVYEGGLYHGRLQFPSNYPFAPPNLMFTTPSGRFETNKKICLSVTGFHPEHWQPAWSSRTILLALREHFRVDDSGSIGYIAMPQHERKHLAAQSRKTECTRCGYKAKDLVGNVAEATDSIPDNRELFTKTAPSPASVNEPAGGSSWWWIVYLVLAVVAFIIAAVIIADP